MIVKNLKRERNLVKLMKIVGSLCEVVRTEKALLKASGYTDEDLAEIEAKAGQEF